MRILRVLSVVVLSMMLFACTTPQPSPSPQTTAPATTSEFTGVEGTTKPEVKYFPTEVHQAIRQMQVGIIQACKGSQNVTALNDCFRQHVVIGYDTSGQGVKACGGVLDLGKFAGCIAEGNLAVAFYGLLPAGDMQPITASDWLYPKPYVDRLDVALSLHFTDLCLEANAGEMQSCVRQQAETALGVAGDEKQRCEAIKPIRDFQQCVAEAFGLHAIRAGVARINAKGV